MAKSISSFQTIRTEGALFPPDILQRIASLKVDGTRAEDYHLPPGFKVKEAITASWTALRAHWTNFQEARESLEEDDTGTAVTNDRWLLPLFKELDYGRLTTEKSPVIDDRSYPIERFYNNTPIHLIGCNLPLDRRTRGARGAATASPHSMMQEFLNRSEHHLWAFVSNGRQLRILRDNISLSRQAFVEFDLEAMMEGEVYSDFALLWLLCHQSRVEAVNQEQCWLESWSGLAREQGTRVLKQLRVGVEKSIEALGQGFISHPRNDQLREKLQSGTLTKDEYYRQLLRIVYRLLFLFVAEDRELLHPTDADPKTSKLYDHYYSTRRLREMAERIRGSKHADLWHSLSLVFHSLGQDDGCPQLGLIGLGSFLWRPSSTADLNGPIPQDLQFHSGSPRPASGREAGGEGLSENDPVYISNDHLLLSIRALAYVEQDRVLRSVDYRNLGSEELGSVYESLLELHPQMHVEAKTFTLDTAAGNERKTTGSYYTPDSLVQCLLDSALEPVVEQRLKEAKQLSQANKSSGSLRPASGKGAGGEGHVSPDWLHRVPFDRRDALTSGNYIQVAEQAILALTVCDPACGSGHFLIAAAHRLARHLARVRTGESEPSPEDHQHGLRDVIARCIYGVDINPMAVELCKVSLWIEAIEPGKPLSFLDHHIQCGNSLQGTTPKLLADGIPNDAFNPIEGDDPEVCRDLRSKNNKERSGAKQHAIQQELWERNVGIKLGNMAEVFAQLSAGDDDSVEAIRKKELEYAKALRGDKYKYCCLLADLWCAAFVWKKEETELGRLCPTQYYLKQVENNPHSIPKAMEAEVKRLAEQYAMFHWHLAYPDVFVLPEKTRKAENEQTGWSRGFDAVLGNPPWETIKLQDKEWFAERYPKIAEAPNAAIRKRMIAALEKSEPTLFSDFVLATRRAAGEQHLVSSSGRYPLCSRGDLNTFGLFAELGRNTANSEGRLGCILPTGIVTDDPYKFFFQDVVDSRTLISVFDFENQKPHFQDVKRTTKFSLFTAFARNSDQHCDSPEFLFFGYDTPDLNDALRRFPMSPKTIRRINPNTRTCPIFRTRRDAALTGVLHEAHDVLVRENAEDGNAWAVHLTTLFHMSGDSGLFNFQGEFKSSGYELRGNVWTNNSESHEPLYEQNLMHAYDHRFASFRHFNGTISSDESVYLTPEQHNEPDEVAIPRYWISSDSLDDRWKQKAISKSWMLAFRQSARTVDSRTGIFCALPRLACGHSIHIADIRLPEPRMGLPRLAEWNSFCWDYLFRQSLGGNNTSFFVIKQVAAVSPGIIRATCQWSLGSNLDWVVARVLELTYAAWDLETFALDCSYDGPPFRWDEDRRFLLRAELDAAYFHLYLGSPKEWGGNNEELRDLFPTPRAAVEYIMETFPIVKRKDLARTEVKNEAGEVVTPGTYITKDAILEIYDEMATAIATCVPYQTRLKPPPGPPTDANGNFIPMADWDPNNWPSHIHPPRCAS